MSTETSVPDYAPLLTAYHRAFARELEAMVVSLPIAKSSSILEMACGDGAYTPWLGSVTGPSGQLVGFDLSIGYLEQAQKVASQFRDGPRTQFIAGSIDRLPFPDDTFDVAWCAQSLFSLPNPLDSVQAMARVVKPGGLVAVLEDDTLHQVLLPWPIEVELAVRVAEWQAFVDEFKSPRKFYVGRRLIQIFREAGLVDRQIRTYATDRVAPIDRNVRAFLTEYLGELREKVGPRLEPSIREAFERLVDPGSPEYLLDQPDLAVTVIDHVVHGRKA